MKKLIMISFLMAALGAKAQSFKIKSYLGDSISVIKGYKQLTPIVITIQGDTARSVLWYIGPISRDSTATTSITVLFYDKNATQLGSRTVGISETTYTKWSTLFTAVDTFIHNQMTRIVLH